ncbi:MAG: CpsD/CapB family tyrosine-protein kinase [Candidatus Korobacteraceae bacterium]|jgi:capsular exopolysaccharide synthesis family protein
MSRIFDALRRSEEEKQPGSERWNLTPGLIPGGLTEEPGLRAEQEIVQDAHAATPALEENSPDLSWLAPEAAAGMANTSAPAPSQPGVSGEFIPERFTKGVPLEQGVPNFALEDFAAMGSVALAPPAIGLGSGQIDLSKLKVVPVSAIPSSMLVALNGERGLGAEKFRVLCARLSNIRLGTTLGVLQVTSSVVGEGKTLTSVNLGMTLATRFDQKVLLVEGDLRKPAVCKLLGMDNHAGIGEWWESPETALDDLLLRIGETGMCVLPAGNVAHPASVLQSPRIAELIAKLAKQFDWIIIDTPPLLPMADSNLWSRVSDGTLMVVRKGTVSRAALKKAVESLDNPKLVGIVLNDASGYDRVDYYDQYYTPRGDGKEAGKAASQ